MKLNLKLLLLGVFAIFVMASCKKDDNDSKLIIKMGAQGNTTAGSFFAFPKNVYIQDVAATKQDTIDLLCFYEHVEPSKINNITLSSPGANITGIFTGTTSPDVWTTKRLTTFTPTYPTTSTDATVPNITIEQFDQLKLNDEVISSFYNAAVTSGNKKAKDLKVGDIYAFKTHDNVYGLFKVITVEQGAEGYVEFELKYKK